ncbi:MAG: hypothetical protein AB7P03_09165 [Kofleriaceae bacterium]
MVVLLSALGVGAAITWFVIDHINRTDRCDEALAELARHLGGNHSVRQRRAWGIARGVNVETRYRIRDLEPGDPEWTEIDVELPKHYPFSLDVRRRSKAISETAIAIGDDAFAQELVVEAAPADVVRELLDAKVRSFLASYDHFELFDVTANDRRVLRFAIQGWIVDAAEVRSAIDHIAEVAARFRDVYAAVAAQSAPAEGGSPYRPEVDASRIDAAQQAREREVAALRQSKTQEVSLGAARWLLIAGVGVVFVMWISMIVGN